MAINTSQDNDDALMSEINMIPFIDVMLVLLIVFIITVPVMQHSINLELPQASAQKAQEKPDIIRLAVNAEGIYSWNDQRVDDTEFVARIAAAAALQPPPALHIRADKAVRYERVAQAMAVAQRGGVRQIAFITEPAP